jgi:hypothetical protein
VNYVFYVVNKKLPNNMADLNISIPHKLSQDEARERIKNLFIDLKRDHKDKVNNIREEWNGNSGSFGFSAMGFNLSGTIDVTPSTVDISANLPMAVMLFKGQIRRLIEEKGSELLNQ